MNPQLQICQYSCACATIQGPCLHALPFLFYLYFVSPCLFYFIFIPLHLALPSALCSTLPLECHKTPPDVCIPFTTITSPKNPWGKTLSLFLSHTTHLDNTSLIVYFLLLVFFCCNKFLPRIRMINKDSRALIPKNSKP